MRRELGIARCGLACCLCSEQAHCRGCEAGDCPTAADCVNRACSLRRGVSHCAFCGEPCRRGKLARARPYAFTLFLRKYGEARLLDRLAELERQGVRYHRDGLRGDYDRFGSVAALLAFLEADGC